MNRADVDRSLALGLLSICCWGCGALWGGQDSAVAPVVPPKAAPQATSDPVYPNCDVDRHCSSKGTVCMNGRCVTCREDAQCIQLGPCGRCQSNQCVTAAGCCIADTDCENGRCRGGLCQSIPKE